MRGSPPADRSVIPNGRPGIACPHPRGREMDRPPPTAPVFVGVDVAKNRLDVHVLPMGHAFALPHATRLPGWSPGGASASS